jgi:hypothetical protein
MGGVAKKKKTKLGCEKDICRVTANFFTIVHFGWGLSREGGGFQPIMNY